MKIKEVEYFKLEMPLAVPYKIAYETVSHTTNIILKIITESGLVGWGCAAPDKVVTGETPDDVITNIDTVVIQLLQGESPFQIARINHELKHEIPNCSSTLAMVDIALQDVLARKAELPMYQMLGGYRNSIATSITIGIKSVSETLEQATSFIKQGFSILKLKGGISIDEDVEKVHLLREKFGKQVKIRFDGNQGYSAQESIDFIKRTEKVEIEIFEQPTNQHKEDKLGKVTQNVKVPVMADESIKTLYDTFRLASNERIDMVNIKLMKMGGISESQHINSVAKAAGLEVMVGCIDECALGISAGLHFALSRPNIQYADLDGHLDLLNDPFKDLFHIRNGVLFPSNEIGLGKINL